MNCPERQSLSVLESGKAAFEPFEGNAMARFTNPLAHVRVASPCKSDWDEMIGTDRVRFCGQCSLNVYNLSAMTRDEAEAVIAANEGRLCVRFYRRRDGSIITQDCPVGLRAVQARISYWMKAVAAAILTFLTVIGVQSLLRSLRPSAPRLTMGAIAARPYSEPVEPIEERIQGQMAIEPRIRPMIGKVPVKPMPRQKRP